MWAGSTSFLPSYLLAAVGSLGGFVFFSVSCPSSVVSCLGFVGRFYLFRYSVSRTIIFAVFSYVVGRVVGHLARPIFVVFTGSFL